MTLDLFLQANLLLAAAYVIFRAARTAIPKLSYRAATRSAQLLMLLSILAPLTLSLAPTRALPDFDVRVLNPLAESIGPSRLTFANPSQTTVVAAPEKAAKRTFVFPLELPVARTLATLLLALAAGLMFLRLLRKRRELRSLLGDSAPLRQLGRVSIVVSDTFAVPFSALLDGRAYVALPLEILGNREDFRVALRHELQHHRQRDTAWAVWVEWLACAFFANPFVHLWKKEINELQELSCDEALIGQRRVSPREYGSCLVRVAEAALGKQVMHVGTTCMASVSGNPMSSSTSFLRRRIEMLFQHKQSRSRLRAGIGLGTVTALVTLTLAYGSQRSFRAAEAPEPNPGVAKFDPAIQAIAEKVLGKHLTEQNAKAGFVLVSEPASGRLLAAASVARDPSMGLRGNWALSYRMEPASAIKTMIGAAAVQQGLTRVDELHDCEKGNYRVRDRIYHDHKKQGFDHLTTAETIITSSNICGIKLAEKLGAQGLRDTFSRMGFGPGGSADEFPGALPGRVPLPEELPEGHFAALIGSGYSSMIITPLEMLSAYGAIANGGRLMKPIPFDAADASIKPVREVLSSEVATAFRTVLSRVVEEGTGKNAHSRLYTTAGKTSTAYDPKLPENIRLGGVTSVAAFVGFAPVNQARVVVYTAVIEPEFGSTMLMRTGGTLAAPIFREVSEQVLQHLRVAHDRN